jgi:hypothetical protein
MRSYRDAPTSRSSFPLALRRPGLRWARLPRERFHVARNPAALNGTAASGLPADVMGPPGARAKARCRPRLVYPLVGSGSDIHTLIGNIRPWDKSAKNWVHIPPST